LPGVYQLLTEEPQTADQMMLAYPHRRKSLMDTLRLLTLQGKVIREGDTYRIPPHVPLTLIEQALANRTAIERAWH
jgi:predicted transcriptional regulator